MPANVGWVAGPSRFPAQRHLDRARARRQSGCWALKASHCFDVQRFGAFVAEEAAGGSTNLRPPSLFHSWFSLSLSELFQAHARCPVTRPGASWRLSHRQAPRVPHRKEPNAALMLGCSNGLASARDTKFLASRGLNKYPLLFSLGGFCGFWFSWDLCQKLFLFSSQSFWTVPALPAGFSDRFSVVERLGGSAPIVSLAMNHNSHSRHCTKGQ